MMVGVSRGGILSITYAGMHPQEVAGVINFVGGWSGERCQFPNNNTLFKRGAKFPCETLWLYGDDDPFFPSHIRGCASRNLSPLAERARSSSSRCRAAMGTW